MYVHSDSARLLYPYTPAPSNALLYRSPQLLHPHMFPSFFWRSYSSRTCFILCSHCLLVMIGRPWFA